MYKPRSRIFIYSIEGIKLCSWVIENVSVNYLCVTFGINFRNDAILKYICLLQISHSYLVIFVYSLIFIIDFFAINNFFGI